MWGWGEHEIGKGTFSFSTQFYLSVHLPAVTSRKPPSLTYLVGGEDIHLYSCRALYIVFTA